MVLTINKVFNIHKQFWCVIVKFDIHAFSLWMKEKHPDWSLKQRRCQIYWQNYVRNVLDKVCKSILKLYNAEELTYTLIPEAMGINIFDTMKNIDIYLDKVIKKDLYKIALIGYKI